MSNEQTSLTVDRLDRARVQDWLDARRANLQTPPAFAGSFPSATPQGHPTWQCPLIEMDIRSRFEACFYTMSSMSAFINQTWDRSDILAFLSYVIDNGLNVIPDIDAEMRDHLSTGSFRSNRCPDPSHFPYPFRTGDGDDQERDPADSPYPFHTGDQERLPRLVPFPCRLCWVCASPPEAAPSAEPAVSEAGLDDLEGTDQLILSALERMTTSSSAGVTPAVPSSQSTASSGVVEHPLDGTLKINSTPADALASQVSGFQENHPHPQKRQRVGRGSGR
ncbi:hypothetical protein A4X13_0g8913 [Tilletia indica]|uniref:Uncharacterized protein n=1 Tax=Tilletia indica TaxID=43049 RepID=A0A177T3Q8_9BASI|nr:hypothetical protein A4X13_0g8913 [Tilletia indica]